MASTPRPNRGRRLRLAVAAAVALTALTTATAGAALPPVETPARAARPGSDAASTTTAAARSGASSTAPVGPRSRFPVFVLDKGRYTGFDSPGEVTNDLIVRINNRGQIAGGYIQDYTEDPPGVPQGRYRGFLRDRRGRFTRIDVAGAAGTTAYDLNDAGVVVGIYSPTNPVPALAADARGFLRDRRGHYTTIGVPGATQVFARGINNRGQVVGEYRDAGGAYHGFLWDKGRVVNLDRGPAGTAVCCSLFDLNDRGQMVGAYLDTAGAFHGLLLDRGRAVTIDAPGVALTFPLAINNRGRIVGATCTTSPCQASRGFLLRDGVDGPFTPIDVPGAPVPGTGATGINDAGVIVGLYENPNAAPSQRRAGMLQMGQMA
jgi:probable HAF family extracellular repeat protein